MPRLLILGVGFFFFGCGSNQFTAVDAAATDAASDGPSAVEGGMGDGGGDSATGPKPRLFASLIDNGGSHALIAWDDPDGISAPRAPDVSIPLGFALDVVAAKNKRVFVAGLSSVFVFDKPLELTSQSTPKSFDKTAFLISGGEILSVSVLEYEPSLDILVTGDDGPSAIETFRAASTMTIGTTAAAKFGTDADDLLHPLMSPGGMLYGGTTGTKTFFWDGAQNASGGIAAGSFVIGAGILELGPNRLYIPTTDLGVGGAGVYVYSHPVMTNMQMWAYELLGAFGQPADTHSAHTAVLSASYLAVGVWKKASMGSFLCIFGNPNALGNTATCTNNIPIANNGTIVRLLERKGSLFVSVSSSTGSRVEIYRAPLTDTKPTVSLDVGLNKLVSGFAVSE